MSKFKISFGDEGSSPQFQEKRQISPDDRSLLATLQKSLLQDAIPDHLSHLDLAYVNQPSEAVDADFSLIIEHDENHIDIVLGDVSGKGIASAIVATKVKEAVPRENLLSRPTELPPVAKIVNYIEEKVFDLLLENDHFVSLFYGRFDFEQMQFHFVDRGFTQALVVQRGGDLYFLSSEDLPLGITRKYPTTQDVLPIHPEDKFLFYSDGVLDVMNQDKEPFGFLQLAKAVDQVKKHDPKTILETLFSKLQEFQGETTFKDDLVMLMIKVLSTANVKAPTKIIPMVGKEEQKQVVTSKEEVVSSPKEERVARKPLIIEGDQEVVPPLPSSPAPEKVEQEAPKTLPQQEPQIAASADDNLAREPHPQEYDPRSFREMQNIQGKIDTLLKSETRFKWSPPEIFQFNLVAHEIAITILQQAEYKEDQEVIQLESEPLDNGVKLTFYYFGPTFDPQDLNNPEIVKHSDQGLNLYIIQKNVNDVRYGKDSKGRSYVEIIKKKRE